MQIIEDASFVSMTKESKFYKEVYPTHNFTNNSSWKKITKNVTLFKRAMLIMVENTKQNIAQTIMNQQAFIVSNL